MHTFTQLRKATRPFPLLAWVGLGLGTVAGVGCDSPVDQPGSKVPGSCQVEAPLVEPLKTDILFVVDNSNSMTEEQAGVATELPAFIAELRKGAGLEQDFQVGLITTSVYEYSNVGGVETRLNFESQSGHLQAVPIPDPNNANNTIAGTEKVLRDDDPLLLDKFSRLVKQGISGSGQETPFEAVRLATDPNLANLPQELGGNAGLFRDGARLLVVVVSDEDDCSETERPPKVSLGADSARDYCGEQAGLLSSVESYAQRFRNLKDRNGRTREVLWAAIAPVARATKEAKGVLEGGVLRNVDCPTSFEPGLRQRQMASLFDPTFANLDSICSASYHDSLVRIASIANASQTVEVKNVPDPRVLFVEVTRANGEVSSCTLDNGGISYEPPADGQNGRIHFQNQCLRRPDDTQVDVKLLCVG